MILCYDKSTEKGVNVMVFNATYNISVNFGEYTYIYIAKWTSWKQRNNIYYVKQRR
jgi:hypothetical protein